MTLYVVKKCTHFLVKNLQSCVQVSKTPGALDTKSMAYDEVQIQNTMHTSESCLPHMAAPNIHSSVTDQRPAATFKLTKNSAYCVSNVNKNKNVS